jgi:hypothetical protein
MRKLLSFAFGLLISLSVISQETENALEQIQISDSTSYTNLNKHSTDRKLKVGVDVNMGYMFSTSGFGGPEFSLTPHVTYPLSDRFWINAGIQAGFGQYMIPTYTSESMNYQMLPMTRMFVYASGNYRMTDKLVLTGSVYRQVLNTSSYSDTQSRMYNYMNNGMAVGFNYKLGSNVSIGAQIQIQSNNYNPYSAGGFSPSGGYANPLPLGW